MFRVALLFSILGVLTSATFTGYSNAADGFKQVEIVAGSHENNFSEAYSIPLVLPISKLELFNIVARLNLIVEPCEEHGAKIDIPAPWHKNHVDFSRAKKCYQIFGERNEINHSAMNWRAYSDEKDEIFYVENAFSYTGP